MRQTLIQEKKKLNRKVVLWMVILSVILLGLSQVAKMIAARNPSLVERAFSRGIYPFTSRIQTGFANLFSFSLYEVVILLLILFGLYRLIRLVQSMFRKNFREELIRFSTQILLIVSIGLFLFQFLWSLNSYRVPLKDQLGLTVQSTSVSQLADTYRALVERANATRSGLPAIIQSSPQKVKHVLDTSWEGYSSLSKQYSIFHDHRVRVKGLLFSRIQTISGYSGVYNFFTGEPNINIEPPLVSLPHTACHEIAHQMGISLEDEANYAGFLACMRHPDTLFRYSALLSAITYTGNALYAQSPEMYSEISALLSDALKADQQEIRDFWDRNQKEAAAEIADRFNEAYLKSNNQPEGMQSYGKFVDLLIADYLEDGNFGIDKP